MDSPAGSAPTACHNLSAAGRSREDRQRLSLALRAWIGWHGLDQRDVAAVLQVSESSVSRLLSPDRSAERRGALHRLVTVIVGPESGLCSACGVLLADGPLATELERLLQERRDDGSA